MKKLLVVMFSTVLLIAGCGDKDDSKTLTESATAETAMEKADDVMKDMAEAAEEAQAAAEDVAEDIKEAMEETEDAAEVGA